LTCHRPKSKFKKEELAMRKNLPKTIGLRMYGSIALSIIVLLMLAIPAFAAEPTEVNPSNGKSLGEIMVPVIFDGVE
jgi:hypothetical protein